MSWMSDISIIIEEARAFGVKLDLSNFGRDDDRLIIDGTDAEEWFAIQERTCRYCGREQADLGRHMELCEPML